ncbi:MAG: sigma 54-interacting transcriptional regulator, partial [Thermotaleaceae bacterium]
MGDDLKIKEMMSLITEMMEIIRSIGIPVSYKDILEEKYSFISLKYNDFIENYLDFREIADNLHDGIYISNGDGNTVFVNKAYVSSTGISKEELIGRNVGEIIREGKLYKGAVTMEVIKKRDVVNSIGTILRNNKEVLVTGKPIFDENGNVKLVVINNRDITELNNLEKKISKLKEDERKAMEEIKFLRSKQVSNKKTIYTNKQMQSIMELVNRVASTDATVLITGESGTGKEVIADEIYYHSKRKDKPFIKVNCSAIPQELFESELFGYEGGAFTDAKKTGKPGLFELAEEGTILLDEIGDMPLKLQSKLLRVLQQKEFIRVGGNKAIKMNVRIIASTNKDLKHEVKEKRFREDLFYRLNVVPIYMMPLRERKEDIETLANEFLNHNNKKYGKQVGLTHASLKMLQDYEWPGNIRELENLIERMVIISQDNTIKEKDLSLILGIEKTNVYADVFEENLNIKEAVQNLERDIITKAIKKYGSTRKAAKYLGIDQSTIVKKCKKIGLI